MGNIPFQTAMPSQNWVHADEDGRQLGHERHGRAMGVGNGDSLARKVQYLLPICFRYPVAVWTRRSLVKQGSRAPQPCSCRAMTLCMIVRLRYRQHSFAPLQLVTLRKNVQRLANLLEVGGSVEARANALVEQVVVGWNSTERVPKSELLTAGCLFIASRESEVPLTIINVALAAGVRICQVCVLVRICTLRRDRFAWRSLICEALSPGHLTSVVAVAGSRIHPRLRSERHRPQLRAFSASAAGPKVHSQDDLCPSAAEASPGTWKLGHCPAAPYHYLAESDSPGVLQAAVLSDALQLHDWMEEREIEGSTIPKASAAIMVAAEASQVGYHWRDRYLL